DLPVTAEWITDAEMAANPALVKTMKVKPPMGQGRVRLIRIGDVDLQPCGGTHVRRTSEIGPLRLGKIEKKGAVNRRVALHFASARSFDWRRIGQSGLDPQRVLAADHAAA